MLYGVKKWWNWSSWPHKETQKAILKASDQTGNIAIILDHSFSLYLHWKLLTKICNHLPNHWMTPLSWPPSSFPSQPLPQVNSHLMDQRCTMTNRLFDWAVMAKPGCHFLSWWEMFNCHVPVEHAELWATFQHAHIQFMYWTVITLLRVVSVYRTHTTIYKIDW